MALKLRELFIVLILVLHYGSVQAAPPSLSIQPENYTYGLSVTGLLVDNCDELRNPGNMLIAYVKGEVRGFVNSSTIVGEKYMAFLTVYSNQPSGDTITFQIYSSDKDKLLEVKTKLIFQDDAVFGSPSVPQEIITNNRPANLALSTLIIPEHASPNPDLAIVSATDADLDNTLTYSLSAGPGSEDNSSFKIIDNKLQFNGKINTFTQDTFKIRLRVADNFNCSVEKEFALIVGRVNDAPTALNLSDSSFFENTQTPTIGHFSGTDPDRGDKLKYSLVAGTGDNDNASFSMLDSSLIFNTSANFEVKNKYTIRCRVTDLGGLFLELPFTIMIKDVNEKPVIKVDSYQIPELAPLFTSLGFVTAKDVDGNQTLKYKILSQGIPFSIDSITGNLILSGSVYYKTKKDYIFWVKVTDNGVPALSDSALIKVIVLDEIEDGVLPSADLVSPNSDGKNDTWKIVNVELYKDYALSIVDDYSQEVYAISGNYANDWDARLNGKALPDGIYYYVLRNNSNGKLFKGYITVIK